MAKSMKKDAVALLKEDHKVVKNLFDDFEDCEDAAEKFEIACKAISELKVHAEIEEEIFYPALRKAGANGIMEEADEEHHVAKLLIAELELMKGDEDNYEAKFAVLAESVRHHIKEEEGEMFKKAMGLEIDLEALGEMMVSRKLELMSTGVPVAVEEEMIKKAGLPHESPAKKAAKSFQLPHSA